MGYITNVLHFLHMLIGFYFDRNGISYGDSIRSTFVRILWLMVDDFLSYFIAKCGSRQEISIAY